MRLTAPYRVLMTTTMTATSAARHLRAQLCDLFEQVGPTAPTLCEGWTAADLAAHLVIREGRPDAALGIVAKPFAARTTRIQRAYAQLPWSQLVAKVRRGAPIWSPLRWLDGAANLIEFAVHLQDVLQANPSTATPQTDAVTQEQIESLVWKRLSAGAQLMFRNVRIPLTFATTGGQVKVVRPGSGIRITGTPMQLVMEATGRHSSALIEGDDAAITTYRQSSRRI
ncbi:MAG: TIGR03085 family protein [Actinobacteria bacterium]|nr:TIGR03085 family protein [Actinomycetota bacterium]